MSDYRWTSLDNMSPLDSWYYRDKLGVRFYDPQEWGWSQSQGNYDNYLHTYRRFGLLPAKKPVISPAKPKLNIVDLEGASTSIDFTESLTGRVEYSRRQGTFRYVTFAPRKYWDEIFRDVTNALNGKLKWIVLDEDFAWFYVGRLTVGNPEYRKDKMFISITADLEPYKRSMIGTLDDWLWNPLNLYNGIIYDSTFQDGIIVPEGETTSVSLNCRGEPSTFVIKVMSRATDLTVTLINERTPSTGITHTIRAVNGGDFVFSDFISGYEENTFIFTSPTEQVVLTVDYRELSL